MATYFQRALRRSRGRTKRLLAGRKIASVMGKLARKYKRTTLRVQRGSIMRYSNPAIRRRDGGSGYLVYNAIAGGNRTVTWIPDVSPGAGGGNTVTLGTLFNDVALPTSASTTFQTRAIPFSLVFKAGNIRNIEEFVPMYEMIKIHGIKLKFIPQFTRGTMYDALVPVMPQFVYRTDMEDAVIPSTATLADIQTMIECSKTKQRSACGMSKMYIKPKTTIQTAGVFGGQFTSGSQFASTQRIIGAGWERLRNNNQGAGQNVVQGTEYMGFKGFLRNLPDSFGTGGSNFTLSWRVQVEYLFEVKVRS